MSEGIIKPAVVEGDGDLELSVQDHLISQPLAEVGIRNSGKSYQAGRICEDLCEVKQPFIVIDPEGEYWTLRERYPVIVAAVGKPLGRPKGYRSDLIITTETAPALARRIAEKGYSVILDLRNATMAEGYEVLGSFLEALYEAEAQFNRPLVVIMEEAHVLVPEIGRVRLPDIKKAQDKVIYWTYEVAARGRHRGLGYVCIARRAAEVAKAVLSQCPNRILFKLVDPADLSWLRESGLSKEEIEAVKKLPQGQALVIGLRDEHFYITSKPRLCTHGGKTPIAMAVETPELESAVADLLQAVKAPVQEIAPPTEITDKLKTSLSMAENRIKELETALAQEKQSKLELMVGSTHELEKLKDRIRDLESKVLTAEERVKYETKIKVLESDTAAMREQVAKAAELESTLEKIRELLGSWKDLMLETGNALGLELVPSDIQAVIEERDDLRKKVDIYEREDALKQELLQQTLQDSNIKSWISDATRFLRDLSRHGQAGEVILKASLRMDPETIFLPEEIQTGYTSPTNLNYLNLLASKGLLWEARKRDRKAFRNRFNTWVTENVRKIKPGAPDGAIEEIAEELKRTVIR